MNHPLRNINANARTRSSDKDNGEKNLWSSMLDSVSSGKKLPEKNLIVLGGSIELQKEFLETLESDAPKRPRDRHRKRPPIANRYALGYTYQDIFDTDHEDLLARLSIYLLSESSENFAPLLKQVLSPTSIPKSLVVLLLDWSEPWHWLRQIRNWVLTLKTLTGTLDQESKDALNSTMEEWQQRRRGGSIFDTGVTSGSSAPVNLPLNSGEWDEPLGLPICVVCHRADEISRLESQYNWREEDFDYILQSLRTILMKHGASLIYTSNSVPNALPLLIQSSLDIQSLLKKQTLKHNVMDRDKILVPPNWDSWGKIRVIREGFDVEGTSIGWSIDVQPQSETPAHEKSDAEAPGSIAVKQINNDENLPLEPPLPEGSVIPSYEATISDPQPSPPTTAPTIELPINPMQTFLASQQERMNKLKADEDAEVAAAAAETARAQEQEREQSSTPTDASKRPRTDAEKIALLTRLPPNNNVKGLQEQIGPVQFNMGGIEVDAEDMVERMKRRPNTRGVGTSDELDSGTSTPVKSGNAKDGGGIETPESKSNEALGNFFADLLKRGGTGSPRTPGSGRKGSRKDREAGGSSMRDVSSAGSGD